MSNLRVSGGGHLFCIYLYVCQQFNDASILLLSIRIGESKCAKKSCHFSEIIQDFCHRIDATVNVVKFQTLSLSFL